MEPQGKSIGNMKKVQTTGNITWTRAHLKCQLKNYVGNLEPDTTYYYRFYGEINGVEY